MSIPPALAAGGPLVLGIESSCDETGVGIVRGHQLLANEVASSVELHVRFGGVVPEVASRAHLEAMVPTLRRACATAKVDLSEIDGIAVTVGPGLMGALVVGLASAKALGYALNKPLYGINHLVGHVAVDLLDHGPLPERCIALLVSGGHTSLLQVGHTTKSPGCWACHIPGAPTLTRPPPAIPVMSASHEASSPAKNWSGTGSISPSQGSRPRWLAGSRQGGATGSMSRWPMWLRAFRRRSAMC